MDRKTYWMSRMGLLLESPQEVVTLRDDGNFSPHQQKIFDEYGVEVVIIPVADFEANQAEAGAGRCEGVSELWTALRAALMQHKQECVMAHWQNRLFVDADRVCTCGAEKHNEPFEAILRKHQLPTE